MKWLQTAFFLLAFILLNNHRVYSQQAKKAGKSRTLTENSIVKDSSGQVYSAEIWQKLIMTGYYTVKPENPLDEQSAFILVRLSDEARQAMLAKAGKPKESKSFKTNKEVSSFTTTDIDGNKIKLKDLKGKIVVLNFWYINCPPCRKEIFELNKLVEEFKDSTGVVFLAIATDGRDELKEFLKREPFNYTIIDNGKSIAAQYNITAYPTHAVIDQQGRVYFHTAGAGPTITHWLKVSILELCTEGNKDN